MAKLQDPTAPLTQDETQTQTKAAAELVPVSKCCAIAQYVTKAGEQRRGVKLHNLKFLPARINEDGQPQTARFSGLIDSFTDPVTGEVRGANKDSVALRFFGAAAEQLSSILNGVPNPQRDSIILACENPDELTLSIYRDEAGRCTGTGASTREFIGNFRLLPAAPEAKVKSE